MAVLLTRGWWAVLALVGLGVWATVTFLPTLATAGGGLSDIISEDTPAVQAQIRAFELFGLPLLTRVAVVQHAPEGLDPYAQARATLRAAEVDEPALRGRPTPPLLLAVPVFDGLPRGLPEGLGAGSVASGAAFARDALASAGPTTTIVTYLFTDPTAPTWLQEQTAEDYAARIDHPGDHLIGVSGTIPLQSEQGQIVADRLAAVEVATVIAIALIVALAFRSLLAPVITLLTAGIAYVVADHVVGTAAAVAGVSAPAQLEPVLVALALGVSTDYAVLFLSGMTRRLRAGEDGRTAARGAVEDYLVIVLVAGGTVTAGVAALSVARTELFQAFGPGLALTVLASLVVSVLLVPPLMTMFGRAVLWPARPRDPRTRERGSWEPDRGRSRFIRLVTTRRFAAPATVVAALAVLAVCALPLASMRESVSPMDSLPEGNSVREAWEGAAAGFAPGVLSPTEILLTAPGITARRDALARLQQAVDDRPGVAGVLGPVQGRLPDQVPDRYGLFLGPRGDAARLLVVLDADPLGASAVETLRSLQRDMPALLAAAGLDGVSAAYAGDTALGLGLVDSARDDLVRVAVVVAAVELLLLVLFLRSLVAPIYLLACSLLVVASSLGLTSWVFGGLGQEGLIFFVPFAVGALLASLGSDYNVFGVGDVWRAARTRPLAEALATAVPRSTRAIGAAGITLAASFGLVALVPLAPFQELAFAMAVGVLLDTFLVRAFLVPALIWWVGPVSAWPSRWMRTGPPGADDRPEPEPDWSPERPHSRALPTGGAPEADRPGPYS